jgi:hypothetical protein
VCVCVYSRALAVEFEAQFAVLQEDSTCRQRRKSDKGRVAVEAKAEEMRAAAERERERRGEREGSERVRGAAEAEAEEMRAAAEVMRAAGMSLLLLWSA